MSENLTRFDLVALKDAHAADAVLNFAVSELGFALEDVVIYGWSIGGFTASWLAMNYPGVKVRV